MRVVIPLPCSLDGISLPVVRITDEFGRTWISHEYPGRNRPELEDMGGQGARFDVECLFAGPLWKVRVGALRATVQAGPALGLHAFLHPFWGFFRGKVEGLRIEHTDDQEDTARVSFRFQEGEALPLAFALAAVAASSQAAAEAAAAAAIAAAAALPD